jgi:hypothetical protein
MALIQERYSDFGPTLAAEKLAELHSLAISRETLRPWMKDAGLWLTRKQRVPRPHQPRERDQADHRGPPVRVGGADLAHPPGAGVGARTAMRAVPPPVAARHGQIPERCRSGGDLQLLVRTVSRVLTEQPTQHQGDLIRCRALTLDWLGARSRQRDVRRAPPSPGPARRPRPVGSRSGDPPGASPVDWSVGKITAPQLAPVRRAIEFLLARHAPYPAVLVDRHRNMVLANQPALGLLPQLVSPAALQPPVNMMRLLFRPDGVRRDVVNWQELAGTLVQRLHREAALAATDAVARAARRRPVRRGRARRLAHHPRRSRASPSSPSTCARRLLLESAGETAS